MRKGKKRRSREKMKLRKKGSKFFIQTFKPN